jgi:hypothetical protein
MNPLIELSLRELIWEIDIRGLDDLQNAYQELRTRFHILENETNIFFCKKKLLSSLN